MIENPGLTSFYPIKREGGRRAPTRDEACGVNPLVRWAFYAFIFSLAFEMGANRDLPFEIPTLLGCVFLLAALTQPRVCYRQPPKAFWWLALYVWLYLSLMALQGAEHEEMVYKRVFYVTQLIFLFWATYNLMRNERMARTTLLALVYSCTALTVLQLSGILTHTFNPNAINRASVMGQNPSNLAGILSVGLLALVGLTFGKDKSALRPRFLVWPLFAAIAFLIVSTGSRGPIIALAAGLSVFILRRGNVWVKMRNALIVLMGAGLLVWFSYQSASLRQRFESSARLGDMAGRERIYPAAWGMFLEKPLLGWGPVNKNFEIQRRARYPGVESRDPHNLVLEVLTGTGLLAGIPLFIGTWLCVRAAWKSRFGPRGVLPFALLVTTLAINMSMDWLYSKTYWFTLAYALASAPVARRVFRRAAIATSGAWQSSVGSGMSIAKGRTIDRAP